MTQRVKVIELHHCFPLKEGTDFKKLFSDAHTCTMLLTPTYIHTNFKGKEKEGMEGGKKEKEREGEMKEREKGVCERQNKV